MNSQKKETAIFAGGCFWCTEAIFKEMKGVESVVPGYIGGKRPNPTLLTSKCQPVQPDMPKRLK